MDLVTFFVHCIIVLTTILVLCYAYFQHAHKYWARKGVPYIPTNFPFGNIASVVFKRQSITDKLHEYYKTAKAKGHEYIGLYIFSRKVLLIVDPDLVKKVLNTDFQYFHDRGIYYDEKNEPLSAHLVALSGQKWKDLRAKLTPTFTSGKIKTMFRTVLTCAEHLTDVLKQNTYEATEIKDIAARYTTDVIGSCAFGINCNSLRNPEAEFRQIGRTVFKQRRFGGFKRMIARIFPRLAKKLRFNLINPDVSDFFIKAVTETVEHRIKNNVSRNDFLQLLIALLERKEDNAITGDALTMNEVCAQAFVFFLAGFETSASTITFALYELAINNEFQEKVRDELFKVLKKHNNMLTYDGILEMRYMETVVLETIRKYPTFSLLMRKCTENYTFEQFTLEKRTPVIIPVYALHHDPDFFPEPEKFNPSRFELEIAKTRNENTFLPFGSGPRICIGLRFAMIQIKIALAMMLQNFKFTVSEKMETPMVMNPNSFFLLTPVDGVWLNVSPLQ